MSTRDLQSILLSGEITGINVGGNTSDDRLMTYDEIRTALLAAGAMAWAGTWVENLTYLQNRVVNDAGWLMISNKETQQRPAPVAIGNPVYSFPVLPVPFLEAEHGGVVLSGHEYTFSRGGWVTEILAYVPNLSDTTNYRIIIADITNPDTPIVTVITDAILSQGGWAKVAVGSTLILPGTVLRIFVDALDSGDDTIVTGGWTYSGTAPAAPTPQNWNSNASETTLRIDKTDLDSTDRASELLGITVNSTILFAETAAPANYKEFTVTANPTDGGTFISYTVNLTDEGGTLVAGDVSTMTAKVPIPQTTKYAESADYWLTNGYPEYCDVVGFVEKDGVPEAGHDDDAYGIGMLFQPAVISEDWDFMSFSDLGGASSGSGSGGSSAYDYVKVVGFVVAGDVYEEVGRLVVDRAAGTYEFKISLTYNLNSTTTSAFIRFSTDNGATWTEFVEEPKDQTNSRPMFYAFPMSHDGGVENFIVQARKENAGDVMNIEYLDIILDRKI